MRNSTVPLRIEEACLPLSPLNWPHMQSPPMPHQVAILFLTFGSLALCAPAAASPKEVSYPWELNTEHRYVWLRKADKVGETRFQIRHVPHPTRRGEMIYEIQARRTYNYGGAIRAARGTTFLTTTGETLRFEETLRAAHVDGNVSEQRTLYERKSESQAQVTYLQPGAKPIVRDHTLEANSFLCGNQAMEHWVAFTASLAGSLDGREVSLLYPDFNRTVRLRIDKKGEEPLRLGGRSIDATRYAFKSTEMSGTLWLDAQNRLLQIEFPSTRLKVVLAGTASRATGAGKSAAQ